MIGDLDQVPDLIKQYGADAVAVTGGDATRHNYLRELSWALEGAGVELLVHPGLVEVAGPRMHIRPYVGLPLLHVEQPHFTGWRRLLKRATDIGLTSVGLVVISPMLAAIALAVKLYDGGPVIFRQTRVGLDGSTFTMLKFRSMHIDAEVQARRAAGPEPEHRHDVQAGERPADHPGGEVPAQVLPGRAAAAVQRAPRTRCRWSVRGRRCSPRSTCTRTTPGAGCWSPRG